MALRRIVFIIILLTGFTSVFANPDVQSDSTATDSISTIDSVYSALITHAPQLNPTPFIIKLFWISISIILIILFWRYLIYPSLLIIMKKWTYKNEVILTLKSIVLIITIYFILTSIVQPPHEVIVIILASIGLATALATKNLLKDIISGLSISYSRLLQISDLIQFEDFKGEVVKLGVKSVQLKRDDDTITIIPNHKINENKIVKLTTGDPISSVDVFFYFPPDIHIINIKEIANRVVSLSRFVYLNKPITTELTNIIQDGKSFVKMRINAYVLDIEYTRQFRSDVTENLLTELLNKKFVSFI